MAACLERPIKDKTGISITTALKFLFQDRKPITIHSDKGTEFVNTNVQQYLKRPGVSFHTTHNSDTKGAIIERYNRTLKIKTYKCFTKKHIPLLSNHIYTLRKLQYLCPFNNRYATN